MTIKGQLIGYDRITSKKGTDCFFGWVLYEFPEHSSGVGLRVASLCAFGYDSVDIQSKIEKGKLLDKQVFVTGMNQGNSFITLDIKPVS